MNLVCKIAAMQTYSCNKTAHMQRLLYITIELYLGGKLKKYSIYSAFSMHNSWNANLCLQLDRAYAKITVYNY